MPSIELECPLLRFPVDLLQRSFSFANYSTHSHIASFFPVSIIYLIVEARTVSSRSEFRSLSSLPGHTLSIVSVPKFLDRIVFLSFWPSLSLYSPAMLFLLLALLAPV